MTTPPNIPVSPATRTSPLKVELSPDGKSVRVTAYGDGAIQVEVAADLDPTDALWLSTLIRAHAETVIAGQVTARRAAAAEKPIDGTRTKADEVAYNRANGLPDNAAPVGMYAPKESS